jgi:hypothetical protein
MNHSFFFKKGVLSRTALPLFFALCLAAGIFSGCDTGVGGYTSPPDVPVIQSVSIKSSKTQTEMTDQGGTITVTWGAVSGAASYEVYYAPKDPDTPTIPVTPAQTVSGTIADITAADIGNNTMNYYVWVKAVNTGGTSAPSDPASTLDRFMGMWTASNSMDGFSITNAEVLYRMLWSGSDDYDVIEYIRAVIPFNNNNSVDFNGNEGPAGIIVIEYDASVDSNIYWSHVAGKYFNAIYYYGLTGNGGAESSAYFGHAADPPSGPDVEDVNAAIAKFTLPAKDSFIDSNYAAEYEWEE